MLRAAKIRYAERFPLGGGGERGPFRAEMHTRVEAVVCDVEKREEELRQICDDNVRIKDSREVSQ